MPQIYKQSVIRHTHPRNVEVTLLWDGERGGRPGLSASGQGLAGPLVDANKIQRHRQWGRLRLLGTPALHEQLRLCGLMGKTSVTTEELGMCHRRPLSQDIYGSPSTTPCSLVTRNKTPNQFSLTMPASEWLLQAVTKNASETPAFSCPLQPSETGPSSS